MNIKHLETFVWIARLGSFSAAARKLNSSQPTVSMRVQELEKDLGVTLFDRTRRSIRVTPKGREFIEYAERILALTAEAEHRLSDQSSLSGRVRLGVTETVALTWLPQFVARLNEEFPAVVIDLDIDLTIGLWRKLRAGNLDLALLPGPAYGPDLVTAFLGSALYTWMASPKRGFSRDVVTPKDLEASPIITLSSDSNMHEIIESWFRDNNAEPHRIDVCNSLGVVAALTVAGLGVSMLPPGIFHREIERGELQVLNIAPAIEPLRFWAVHPRQRENALVRVMVGRAREISTFDFTDRLRDRPKVLAAAGAA